MTLNLCSPTHHPIHRCAVASQSAWLTSPHGWQLTTWSSIPAELLFIPGNAGPHHDPAISFKNSSLTPTEDAGSLGVILDRLQQLAPGWSSFAGHQALAADPEWSSSAGLQSSPVQSCHFTAAVPSLAYCSCRPQVWNSEAYKAKMGPAPRSLMAMVKNRSLPRALRALGTARLEPPSFKTQGRWASRLFSVLAPRWWNELPLAVRSADSLLVFNRREPMSLHCRS